MLISPTLWLKKPSEYLRLEIEERSSEQKGEIGGSGTRRGSRRRDEQTVRKRNEMITVAGDLIGEKEECRRGHERGRKSSEQFQSSHVKPNPSFLFWLLFNYNWLILIKLMWCLIMINMNQWIIKWKSENIMKTWVWILLGQGPSLATPPIGVHHLFFLQKSITKTTLG